MPASNFEHGGVTRSAGAALPPGYRGLERRTLLGEGPEIRDAAIAAVLCWAVKTRAGFRVHPSTPSVRVGDEFTIRLGPIREPVRVEWLDAAGFGYTTLHGHPLSGEEAFLVEQDSSGRVWFVNRSVSRPATARWRALGPLLRLAQAFFVRRYGRVLQSATPAAIPPNTRPLQ